MINFLKKKFNENKIMSVDSFVGDIAIEPGETVEYTATFVSNSKVTTLKNEGPTVIYLGGTFHNLKIYKGLPDDFFNAT